MSETQGVQERGGAVSVPPDGGRASGHGSSLLQGEQAAHSSGGDPPRSANRRARDSKKRGGDGPLGAQGCMRSRVANVPRTTRQQHKARTPNNHRVIPCFEDVEKQNIVEKIRGIAADMASNNLELSIVREMLRLSDDNFRLHQDCIGQVPGVLEGLVAAAKGRTSLRYRACWSLAQLAWSHDPNSALLPNIPGSLDALADVLSSQHQSEAAEHAAICVGNCGANRAEAALQMVEHAGLMEALVKAIRCGSPKCQEKAVIALKNCSATSKQAACTIARTPQLLSAILHVAQLRDDPDLRHQGLGVINCLSRCAAAVPILRRSHVVDRVLAPLGAVPDHGAGGELVELTIACAMANLTATQSDERLFEELSETPQGARAMQTLVRLMGLALERGSWNNVCFTPLSVIYPLHNILRCSSRAQRTVLANLPELVGTLNSLLSNPIRPRDLGVGLEALEVGVKACRLLLRSPRALQLLRGAGVLSSLLSLPDFLARTVAGCCLDEYEDAVAGRIERLASTAVEELLEPAVALCMGAHPRLGAASPLRALNRDVLACILSHLFHRPQSHVDEASS